MRVPLNAQRWGQRLQGASQRAVLQREQRAATRRALLAVLQVLWDESELPLEPLLPVQWASWQPERRPAMMPLVPGAWEERPQVPLALPPAQ